MNADTDSVIPAKAEIQIIHHREIALLILSAVLYNEAVNSD